MKHHPSFQRWPPIGRLGFLRYPRRWCRSGILAASVLAMPIALSGDEADPASEPAPLPPVAETNAVAAVIEPEPLRVDESSGNLYFQTAWQPRAGLRLRLSPAGPSRQPAVEWILDRERPELRVVRRDGHTLGDPLTPVRWRPESLPSQAMDRVEWLLKIRPDHWRLYCDDRWVAWLPAPFPAPLELRPWRANRMADDVILESFFQRVDPIRFTDDFMIPETEDAGLGEWELVSGNWLVHSVLDEAPEAQRRGRALRPEFSPNFYSLKGSGTNAVIVAGFGFYDNYRYAASIEMQSGEMGLIFYYREMEEDYYALTLTLESGAGGPAMAALWHTVDGDPDRRQYLAAARVPDLFSDQWVRLEVVARDDRITASLDGYPLFDIDHPMPGGGAFGLFADADTDILFDDAEVVSVGALDLRKPEDLLFHRVAERGDFFPSSRRSWWSKLTGDQGSATAMPDGWLRPAVSDTDQWLALGSPHHAGQVISAVFQPDRLPVEVGWVAGITPDETGGAPTGSHYRFTLQRTGLEDVFRLFRVDDRERVIPLELFRRPLAAAPDAPVTLMMDLSESTRLRFYSDGDLVLVHEPERRPVGAAGPWLGSHSPAAIHDLRYAFERDDLWVSQREKNPVYLQDPFMRHWSSPEGEWHTDEQGLTWHKSDFFGRFALTMPTVSNAAVHLGIREGQTNGALIVSVRNNVATLHTLADDNGTPQRVMSAELLAPQMRAATNPPPFSIRYEDHWFYLLSQDRTVLRHALATPLKGTRIRIEGFSVEDLAHVDVERHQVHDHLFTEAPADWRFNGGDWRIINRFQCDPRWSHMNAESRDGLAAAWTKHWFEGDFSIEMYAGTRHGWYQRCGDLNLTVMSRDGTPSQGYTVTGTGWDPDLSQLDSVLYRHGVAVARTNAYLAPRHRAGNRRLRLESIVRAGRDVHGAWYYIRMRRIGNRLEYYFDNELIFASDDEEPIDLGRVGIWTYMNSVMIARVSISAQARSPTPLAIEPLPAAQWVRPVVRSDPDAIVDGDGTPPDAGPDPQADPWLPAPMRADAWAADDPVGRARLTWHQDAYHGPYFVLETRLGSGPMFAGSTAPAVPYRDLAGWRFFVKRTPRANFNAYFSIGTRDGKGQYVPAQQYFHQLSGTDFDRSPWRLAGATDLPAITATAQGVPWHIADRWQRVEIWLPTDALPAAPDAANLWVRFEGFGVRQPSFEMQGLYGNGPGEGYAVARFAPVRIGIPPPHQVREDPAAAETDTATDADAAAEIVAEIVADPPPPPPEPVYRLFTGVSRQHVLAEGPAGLVDDRMRAQASIGLNAFWLDGSPPQPGYPRDLLWIAPTDELDLRTEWCDQVPDTVRISAPVSWPERRLALLAIQMDGQPLTHQPDGFNRRRIRIPPRQLEPETAPVVNLTVTAASGQVLDVALDGNDPQRHALGPVLTRLEGVTPVYENFELLEYGSVLQADGARMTLRREDPEQGAFTEIANRALGQRLRVNLATPVCLARYPLMQFRYRGDRMSLLSLQLHNTWLVRLNEAHGNAAEVRFTSPFVNDGTWRTWSGMISEVVHRPAFSHRMYTIGTLSLGSFHGIDQTGAFSRWALDDIVLGPAVAQAGQLAFTAHFGGLLPVTQVEMTVLPGLEPVPDWDADRLDDLAWQAIGNGERVQPDVAAVPDGAAQLVLRARDAGGVWSRPVTLPFLLDRVAPRVTHTFEASKNPLGNGTLLRLDFDTGDGSPILLETVRLGLNQQPPVTIDTFLNTVALRAPGLRVHLNWPFLLRQAIQNHSPGEPALIRVSGLRDGAGNKAADIEIPLDIPAKDDTTGPTWLPPVFPDAVRWTTAWEGQAKPAVHFSAAQNNPIEVQQPWNEEPWLRTQTHGAAGNIALAFDKTEWALAQHPFLAFRLRQPVIRDDNPAHVELVITLDNKKTARVTLTHPAADKRAALPHPIAWTSNQWHGIIFNVPQLLLEQTNIKDVDQRKVQSIAFARSNAVDKLQLDLQNLYVFQAWKTNDTVTVDAYDQSGVAGLEWQFMDRNEKILSDHLNPRNPPPNTAGWLVVRARDRADNLSAPLRIPLFIDASEAAVPFADRIRRMLRLAP